MRESNKYLEYRSLNGSKRICFLERLFVARTFLVTFLLIVIGILDISDSQGNSSSLLFLYDGIIIGFLVIIASGLWLRVHRVGQCFIALQMICDVLLITGIVYASGSVVSPFIVLYLPYVMLVSITSNRYAGLAAGLLSSIAYSLHAWLVLAGIMPLSLVNSEYVHSYPVGAVWYQVLGLTSGMVLVAIATNYLKGGIVKGSQIVEKSLRDYSILDARYKVFLEEIDQSVIITDSNDKVMSVNESFERFFSVVEKEVLGMKLRDLSEKYVVGLKPLSFQDSADSTKREHEYQSEGNTYKISYAARKFGDSSESTFGVLHIINDVTDIRSAEERLRSQEEMAALIARSDSEIEECSDSISSEIIAESAAMKTISNLVKRVSETDATVLITGESGTGKELVARAIHKRSKRSKAKLVSVNCGAIPEHLLESHFFGHKKGAFTGATSDHLGFFREANGGTLLLDEVAELPLLMQTKLLRVLQEKQVRPVGGDSELSVDVRIVSATHRDLRSEVNNGRFREDLFYRLNVIAIPLPSLKDRREDIPLLVDHFLRKLYADRSQRPVIHPATMMRLMSYRYPGNIRELQNILERASVLGGKAILPEHLPESIRDENRSKRAQGTGTKKETTVLEMDSFQVPCDIDKILRDVEKKYIVSALNKANGKKKEAARLLGINSRSLRYRLNKFQLTDDES